MENDGSFTAGAILILAAGLLWYFEPFSSNEVYTAEVGYYEGGQIKYAYEYNYPDLETCRAYARATYGYYNTQNRAQSWSCLLTDSGGRYLSRHR